MWSTNSIFNINMMLCIIYYSVVGLLRGGPPQTEPILASCAPIPSMKDNIPHAWWPHRGRRIFLIVPYGSPLSHMVPHCPTWFPIVPYGSLWSHMVPYCPIWIPVVPRAQGPWGAHVDAIDNPEDEQKIRYWAKKYGYWAKTKLLNNNKLLDSN